MKKIILLAALLLSISVGYAQFNLGIKAGYSSSLSIDNLSSIKTGDYNLHSLNSELSNGFHAGVFARFNLNKVYFQPEFLYEMGKKDYTITLKDAVDQDVTFDKFVTVGTLDVPLLVGYKLIEIRTLNLRVFAGPKLRFNAGSSLDYENLETVGSLTKEDLEKDIKKAQLGLEGGIGIDFLMLTLDARLNLISDMYETKINNITLDNTHANTLVISLGWKLF